jgi:hypothetical protein
MGNHLPPLMESSERDSLAPHLVRSEKPFVNPLETPEQRQLASLERGAQATTITYEVVDGNDLTPHYGKRPTARTISEAVANGLGPADYIVAVVNGWMRELTSEEELEYQSARRENMAQTKRTA